MTTILKELKSQHRNIIQMSFNGYKNNEIAERLGMTQSTVSIILHSPLGQAYLNGLQDRAHEATLDVRKKLVSLNKDALDTFSHLLDKSSRKAVPASVQFNAAKDVLDRNGYKAPDRLNIDMMLQTKTDEELDAEINAIEAAINKTIKGKGLPEINSFSTKTNSTDPPSLDKSSSFVVVPSATSSPESMTTANEAEFSLEDFFEYSDALEVDEVPLIEDPSLLDDLPVDIFHSGKR